MYEINVLYTLHLHNVIGQTHSIKKFPYPAENIQASKANGSPESVPFLRVAAAMWMAGWSPPMEGKAQVLTKESGRTTGRTPWIQKVLEDTKVLS